MRLYLLLDQQLHATRLSTIEKDNRIEKLKVKRLLFKKYKVFVAGVWKKIWPLK